MARRVGLDMIDVDEVSESLRVHGEHYLERVYTPAERRQCGTSARRLAERFAAKEATMKALASGERLPWTSIAVTTDELGRPVVELTGPASALARDRGAGRLTVSWARAGTLALAVVICAGSEERRTAVAGAYP